MPRSEHTHRSAPGKDPPVCPGTFCKHLHRIRLLSETTSQNKLLLCVYTRQPGRARCYVSVALLMRSLRSPSMCRGLDIHFLHIVRNDLSSNIGWSSMMQKEHDATQKRAGWMAAAHVHAVFARLDNRTASLRTSRTRSAQAHRGLTPCCRTAASQHRLPAKRIPLTVKGKEGGRNIQTGTRRNTVSCPPVRLIQPHAYHDESLPMAIHVLF